MKNVYRLFMASLFVILSINAMSLEPVPANLYIIGSATSTGWDIGTAKSLSQMTSGNFVYEGVLNAGEFKFLTDNMGDWGQAMYMMAVGNPAKAYYHAPGAPDDSKWSITTSGNYRVVINTLTLDVTITEVFDALYMVGDATPNGWWISDATPMQLVQGSTTQYYYSGPLTVGSFKLPVNRNIDWSQPMYMSDNQDASKMYLHTSGSDDNQWSITQAGNYLVVADVQALTISISLATSLTYDMDNAVRLMNNIVSNELVFLNLRNFQFEIFTIIGGSVLRGEASNGNVDIASLSTGTYIITYNGDTGTGAFKFIVNR